MSPKKLLAERNKIFLAMGFAMIIPLALLVTAMASSHWLIFDIAGRPFGFMGPMMGGMTIQRVEMGLFYTCVNRPFVPDICVSNLQEELTFLPCVGFCGKYQAAQGLIITSAILLVVSLVAFVALASKDNRIGKLVGGAVGVLSGLLALIGAIVMINIRYDNFMAMNFGFGMMGSMGWGDFWWIGYALVLAIIAGLLALVLPVVALAGDFVAQRRKRRADSESGN